MFYDRGALKIRAKQSLRGAQPRPWKVTLLYLVLVGLIPAVLQLIFPNDTMRASLALLHDLAADPEGFLMAMNGMDYNEMMEFYRELAAPGVALGLVTTFVTILVRLFQVVMEYGYDLYGLHLYRGEETRTGDIFSGFPAAGRAIGAAIMTYIFEFLWTMLAVALGISATLIVMVSLGAFASEEMAIVLGVLLLIAIWVPVILFSVFISYRYSLAPYLIMTSDMGVMDAIRASKEYMRGNLGRRFVLDLSFIGWELLNALIAMVVIFLGIFVSIFIGGFQMTVVEDYDLLVSTILVGYLVSAVVAALATVPLTLWLNPYKASAQAGFFLAVSGQEGPPAQPFAPIPQPPRPQSGPAWDNIPQPPAFTDPQPPVKEPEPPAAEPQPPVVEAPVEPQAVTEAPVEPVAEAPAQAETPAEPVEEVPAEPVEEAQAPVEEAPAEPEAETPAEEPKGEEQV